MSRSISRLVLIATIGLVGFMGFGCTRGGESPLGPPDAVTLPPSPERTTIENAQIVWDAIDVWIAGSDLRRFPYYLQERNEGGKTIVDLLPDGQLLLNPFTGERTEPRYPSSWSEPGAIYFLGSAYYRSGYNVVAFGSDGVLWQRSRQTIDIKQAEPRTLVNLAILWIAVEDWARENGGTYPCLLSEPNSAGRTVTDLLPEGQLLENPFTRTNTEPSSLGLAPAPAVGAAPGQIGYYCMQSGGANVGYEILAIDIHLETLYLLVHGGPFDTQFDLDEFATEHSDVELYTLSRALTVREAVRTWSAENGGGYPATLDTANLMGHTVLDLLPGGTRLPNAYTQAATEPRDEAATASGQIGYRGILDGDAYSNYRIEAYGNEGVIWSYEPHRI